MPFFQTTSDNIISRRSSRFDHTMSTMVANNKASTNGRNGSATSPPDKTKLKLAGNSNHENTPELMNLITIENSKEDMIKVESY